MMGFRFSLAPLFALLVFAMCGGIIWLAHIEAGEMTANQGPALVKAAATPIKRSPDDPGGSDVASLGGVGDLLRDQPAEAEEQFLPRAEQPVRPTEGADSRGTPVPRPGDNPQLDALIAEVRNGILAERLGSGGPNPDLPVTFPSPPRPVGSFQTETAEISPSRIVASRTVEVGLAPAEEPTGQLTAAASPLFETAADGRFRVQLAAVRDESDAQRAWDIFQNQVGPFIADLEPFFERAETSNGIFYRLQVGPFGDTAEADRLCNELKKQDVSCFVVSR